MAAAASSSAPSAETPAPALCQGIASVSRDDAVLAVAHGPTVCFIALDQSPWTAQRVELAATSADAQVPSRALRKLAFGAKSDLLVTAGDGRVIAVFQRPSASDSSAAPWAQTASRVMPRRISALAFDTERDLAIVGDRMGTIAGFVTTPKAAAWVQEERTLRISKRKGPTPAAEAAALTEPADPSKSLLEASAEFPMFGHYAFVTEVIHVPSQGVVISSDRELKIRVTKWPDTFIINGFCFGHTRFVSCVEVVSDAVADGLGMWMLSGSADGTVRLWDFDKCTELACVELAKVAGPYDAHASADDLKEPPIPIRVRFHKPSRTVAIVTNVHAKVILMRVTAEGGLEPLAPIAVRSPPVDCAFSSDGKLFVVAVNPRLEVFALQKSGAAPVPVQVPADVLAALSEGLDMKLPPLFIPERRVGSFTSDHKASVLEVVDKEDEPSAAASGGDQKPEEPARKKPRVDNAV